MMNETSVKELLFTCDRQANIVRVLRDDSGIFNNYRLPVCFFEFFNPAWKDKAREFWDALIKEAVILDWELIAGVKKIAVSLKFSGYVLEDNLLVTATRGNQAIDPMIAELKRINNEQQNLLRHSEKSLSKLIKSGEIVNLDFLNEMTLLNNELVNTQRRLTKQHAEIDQLNRELKDINVDLEQFAYVASHDLREPLRMVVSFIELVKNKHSGQLDEKAQSYISLALDAGYRMQNMIGDLLELSRIARRQEDREPVNLNEIVKEVMENIFKLIEENGAEIVIGTQLPVLLIIRADMTRLFQNLISNAIKFRKKEINPVVLINVTEQEDTWLFSITDNGIGIDAESVVKVFEIFTRLHSRRNYEGSGIGLAICKKIVEHNGGTIHIESEEGTGSSVYFTLKKLKNNEPHSYFDGVG